jgi:hypothetical protein
MYRLAAMDLAHPEQWWNTGPWKITVPTVSETWDTDWVNRIVSCTLTQKCGPVLAALGPDGVNSRFFSTPIHVRGGERLVVSEGTKIRHYAPGIPVRGEGDGKMIRLAPAELVGGSDGEKTTPPAPPLLSVNGKKDLDPTKRPLTAVAATFKSDANELEVYDAS